MIKFNKAQKIKEYENVLKSIDDIQGMSPYYLRFDKYHSCTIKGRI